MTGTGGSHDFAYVDSDIPEGMTIRDWQAQRAAARIAIRDAAREDRRRRRAHHMRRWLEIPHVLVPRQRLHRG
jgi:hypothetical protein